MKEQLKKLTNPDSLISLFLGLAVVIVIGVMIMNYVRGKQTTGTESETKQEQTATQSATLPATHKVVAGETLWSIAEKTIGSGYNWVDIAKANNLTNPDMIKVDDMLTIPNVQKLEPGQVSSASMEVKKPADSKYTIQKGDSLWSISVSVYGTGYRWSEIAQLNKLTDPNMIFSGNVLQLP